MFDHTPDQSTGRAKVRSADGMMKVMATATAPIGHHHG
jgi:hypothetical protein